VEELTALTTNIQSRITHLGEESGDTALQMSKLQEKQSYLGE